MSRLKILLNSTRIYTPAPPLKLPPLFQNGLKQWAAMGDSKNKYIKQIHTLGTRLINSTHPHERFLSRIKKEPLSISIYSSHENPIKALSELCNERKPIQLRGLIGWSCCVPFSMLLTPLPLPNFVLFYNVYRVYGNWSALRGCNFLQKSLASAKIEVLKESEYKEE